MPAKYSHKRLTFFFVFFLLASGLLLSCAGHASQSFARAQSAPPPVAPDAVNINVADANELQNIPGIGPALAKKIIEHRESHGPFRRPEDILIVDGISEKRFHEFRSFILIE